MPGKYFIISYLVRWASIIKTAFTMREVSPLAFYHGTSIFLPFLMQLGFLLLSFIAIHASASEAQSPTAAETDWQAAAEMTALSRAALPNYCHGQYLDPMADIVPLHQDEGIVEGVADSATYVQGQSAIFTGNAIITRAFGEIRAPRIVQDEQNQIARIDGPLVIRERGLVITGGSAISNLFDGTGEINEATFLLHQSELRGSATQLRLNANSQILLKDASFTRCDPGSNAWKINGSKMKLDPDKGYGTARGMSLRIKDLPIFYLPYLRFPLDDKRLSGFLLPGIGYDSDGGTDLELPYYFNIAPNIDATYTIRSLWRRGLSHNAQLRWLNSQSMNELNIGLLAKDKLYDIRNTEDLTSAGTDTSSIPIPDFIAQDRWFLNARHKSGKNKHWKTLINYSLISDTDYLHDIGGEVGSSSVEQFTNSIGANFLNRRVAALDQIGQIKYRGSSWNAEFLVQGFQNLDPEGREQYRKLPSLGLDWSHHLGPIDLALNTNYTLFDKNNDKLSGVLATVGQRGVVALDAALPYRKQWGFIEPSVGVLHRKYNLNQVVPGARDTPEETTLNFSIDSGLYFDRFYQWDNENIQQTLEPRLYFLYVENDEQSDLPQFDASASTLRYSSLFRKNRYAGYDRVGDAQHISLGLTSRFMKEASGAEFFSTSIGQIIYLKDRQVNFRANAGNDPTAPRSALFTQARLALNNNLTASGSFEWEPEVKRSNRGTFALKYRLGERKILNMNYSYTAPEVKRPSLRNISEQSDVNFIWPVSKQWSLIGKWNFDWDDNRTIESFAGLEYNDCCWKSRLVIRRFLKEPRTITSLLDDPSRPGEFIKVSQTITPADVGIFFEFQLKGLATLGKRLDSLLEDAIPGYRARENLIGL